MIIENAIEIEAPADIVWAVTEDVERWPEWTPTVTACRLLDNGPFRLGSVARIKQPGQPESEWTVTEYVRGERFTWETRRPGLRMAASHEVRWEGSWTSNRLRVRVRGIIAVVLWPLLRFAIRRALMHENRGLKARCESLADAMPSSQP